MEPIIKRPVELVEAKLRPNADKATYDREEKAVKTALLSEDPMAILMMLEADPIKTVTAYGSTYLLPIITSDPRAYFICKSVQEGMAKSDPNYRLFQLLENLPNSHDASMLLISESLRDLKALDDTFNEVRYDGYDSKAVLKLLFTKFLPADVVRISMIVALRGTQLKTIGAYRIGPMTINDLVSRGFLAQNGSKGAKDLTLQRIASVSPQIAGRALFELSSAKDVPKRFSELIIPGFLQFPTAVGLPWNNIYKPVARMMAIEFTSAFGANLNLRLIDQILSNPVIIPAGKEWDKFRSLRYFNPATQATEEETKAKGLCENAFALLANAAEQFSGNILMMSQIADKEVRDKALKAIVEKKKK